MWAISNGPETNVRFSEAHWSALEGVALDRGHVHVYAARIGSRTQPENAVELLSREELERARSFVRHTDRLHFIESHAFLRRILACYAKVAPVEIRFENGPRGKPRMSGVQGSRFVEFSL